MKQHQMDRIHFHATNVQMFTHQSKENWEIKKEEERIEKGFVAFIRNTNLGRIMEREKEWRRNAAEELEGK